MSPRSAAAFAPAAPPSPPSPASPATVTMSARQHRRLAALVRDYRQLVDLNAESPGTIPSTRVERADLAADLAHYLSVYGVDADRVVILDGFAVSYHYDADSNLRINSAVAPEVVIEEDGF